MVGSEMLLWKLSCLGFCHCPMLPPECFRKLFVQMLPAASAVPRKNQRLASLPSQARVLKREWHMPGAGYVAVESMRKRQSPTMGPTIRVLGVRTSLLHTLLPKVFFAPV